MSSLRKFWSAGVIVLTATVASNIATYVFQAVLSRWLNDDAFGAVKWANDWLAYVLTPVAALQLAMTRYAAVYDAQADPAAVAALAWRATRRLLWYAGAFVTFVAVMHSWLVMGFRLEQQPSLLWVAAGLVLIQLAVPVTASMLQGLQQFRWLAAVYFVQGCGRVVFGLGLVALGLGAVGAVGGQLLAMVAGTLLSLWALRRFWHHRRADHAAFDTRPVYRYFWPALVVSFSIATINYVDMSYVRHYFDTEHSGQYAKAKMIAQAFGFLVGPLAVVLFPKAAGDSARGSADAMRALRHSLGATAALGLLVGAVCSLWPWLPVRILAGPGNATAEALVGPFVWAMMPQALVNLPVQFFLARAEFRKLLVPLAVLVIAYPTALWLWHDSLMQVLVVVAAAGAAALAVLLWSLRHAGR